MNAQPSPSPSQVSDELIARRKEVFKLFDDAKFSASHVRLCLVASAGFFTDGYTLYAVLFIFPMLMLAYPDDPSIQKFRVIIKTSTWIGCIFGHILFGFMTDKYGRKKMFGVELIIVTIGTIYSAISGQGHDLSFVGAFVFCRVILGIGAGGDYPISALIISELAPTKYRGTMLAAGYAMFTIGALTATTVSVIGLVTFHDSIIQDSRNLDRVWRITVGLGALPAIIALYFRLSIPETPRYLIDVENEIDWSRNIEVSQIGNYEYPRLTHYTSRGNHLRNMYHHFRSGKSGKYLLLTCLMWFCTNINPSLYPNFVLVKNGNLPYNSLLEYCSNYVLWLLMGYVPGALLTVYLIDRLGRKPILYIGFTVCAVLFFVRGLLVMFVHGDTYPDRTPLYYAVSTVILFFLTFGPRSANIIVPAEIFPTRYRSTAYGISVAFGKLSYVISYQIAEWINDVKSVESFRARYLGVSIGWVAFMVIGAVSATYLPETKHKTLEEITDNDELDKSLYTSVK